MIPRELTGLVGRQRELAELEALVSDRPLLTLQGPGGSGKTRLALRLARHAEHRLEDGVVWVDLAPIGDAAHVARTVCATMGLVDRGGMEPEVALRSHLRDRRLLLVMDNCEHVIRGCAELVAFLLSAAPALSILTTSREPLHVPGETVWLVPSLGIPDDMASRRGTGDPQSLMAYESVQLFAARAAEAMPGFQITADNGDAVARICRRVEGIPLAIELCVAHLRTLPPQQVADRLERGLPLPVSRGRMGIPPPHTRRDDRVEPRPADRIGTHPLPPPRRVRRPGIAGLAPSGVRGGRSAQLGCAGCDRAADRQVPGRGAR